MTLPVKDIVQPLLSTLETHNSVVVTAPPGAGKSTLLPLELVQSGVVEGKVLMLEPRRLAARQIAARMAWMLNEEVGDTVGYRIRFERKVSARTRLEVLTEGMMTRLLVDNPLLEGVGMVIFDEFHERSLQTDVALALTRDIQQMLRPDLKIVVMSATLDTALLCQTLQAPLLESQGRMFPVTPLQLPGLSLDGEQFPPAEVAQTAARAIMAAHREQEGDILVFLPGEGEIRRVQDLLGDSLAPTLVCPLYGMLSMAEQRRAIAPSPAGQRKVVLATSIAETSLTIEGVRTVIDTGLCRESRFDPRNGLSRLTTVRISHDRATQRMGRAGRVAAGVCYRLWSTATDHRLAPCRTPEIEEADLAPVLLDIAAWGENHPERLPWLTPLPAAHVSAARTLLRQLGALDEAGRITPHGHQLAQLPCHPRLAQMLVRANDNRTQALAADIAALLDERDPLGESRTTDFCARIDLLRRQRTRHQTTLPRLLAAAEQYRRMMGAREDNSEVRPTEVGALLAAAYPERIARHLEREPGRFRPAMGDTLFMERDDDLAEEEWIVVASLDAGSGRIFLAAPLAIEDLRPLAHPCANISWDNRKGAVVAQQEERIGQLVIASRPLGEGHGEAITEVICEAVARQGAALLDFSDEVEALIRRVAAVASWHPELALPDLSPEAVLAHTREWLPPFLGKATTTAELKKIDLTTALWSLLSYEQQQAVDRLAPTHLTVPTGSHIRVEYRKGAESPILRVRLQECFGLTETPRVDNDTRPVLMELLSPGYKPVQLTQDLHSFWQYTYFEVRSELRRRYPKHAWPDNPLEAEAVRGVKKKR